MVNFLSVGLPKTNFLIKPHILHLNGEFTNLTGKNNV